MNDIDRLKDLLFGNEKKALDAITRRLEIPESRTADIADVLPEALLRSHASDARLARALEEPVEQCLKSSIRKNPGDFADALFPVIGPAIRKAIAEALRSMTQSLNQAIENSLSLRTRFKAWRAGVPLGDYILQRNLVYRVEQAFLIKREDGLLIEHVHHEGALSKDSDAVSAMFTAIQDFIQDSFRQEGGQTLTKAELGELSLWGIHGPHTVLVCVVRGVAPAGLRNELSEVMERIHLNYGDALAKYNGNPDSVAGVGLELERCLLLEHRDVQGRAAGKPPVAVYLLLAVLIGLVAWWAGSSYGQARRLANFRSALEATPGIVVQELRKQDGAVILRGLRDPLAADPAEIAPAAHIDPAELVVRMAAYQSLDAPIIERRARRILQPPRGVGISLDGTRLRLSGSAPASWKEHALTIGPAIPGVARVDLSAMTLSREEILAAARAVLQPPETVQLQLDGSRLRGTGSAPAAWLRDSAGRVGLVSSVSGVDLTGVVANEQQSLRRLLRAADRTEVFFDRLDRLAPGQAATLDALTNQLDSINSVVTELKLVPRVVITGHTDGVGSAASNERLAQRRAEVVAEHLVRGGIPVGWIQIRSAVSGSGSTENADLRKAVVRVGVEQAG